MKESRPARVADVVLDPLHATEREGSLATRLGRAQSAALELFRLHCRVKLQLLGQLTLVASPEEDRPRALDDVGQHAHARPPSGTSRAFMTQFTAADARSHEACSNPSCFRPAAVSS